MRPFVSVLSESASPQFSFAEATLAGWAPDGGMFWPATAPTIDRTQLLEWAALSYTELCAALLREFVDDNDELTPADLDAIVHRAFESFGSPAVVEQRELPAAALGMGDADASVWVLELWHGPTLAFKDLGMSVLGRVLSHLLERRRERLTLLVGTSGDTGSSAIEAVRDLPNIEMVVLYPLQGFSSITAVQEQQMTTVRARNVHVIGVEGSSDDLDVPMEQLFRDAAFKRRHRLGSVNSVNVVRLLVQAAHYFYSYLRVEPTAERRVHFAVPCGAGGHLAAGLLAVQMGLPAILLGGTNANDALHRVLATGELSRGAVVPTASPSMDIMLPYNLWRLLYVASGGDARAVRGWQADLATGRLQLPPDVRAWLASRVRTAAVSDAQTLGTLRRVHALSGYVLDPHTAVGVAAAAELLGAPAPPAARAAPVRVVCMACAHPVKFLPAVAAALGYSGPAAALDALPASELAAHPCVAAVGRLARGACEGYPPGQTMPPGCCMVLRRGQDWESLLRGKVESFARSGAGESDQQSRPRPKL